MNETNHSELAEKIIMDIAGKYECRNVVPETFTCRSWRQGNFTIVLLNDQYVGVSKRNKTDAPNQMTGLCTAITRAAKALLNVKKENR